MGKTLSAREAALLTLHGTNEGGAYLNLALHRLSSEKKLDARDFSLASELIFGVTRNRLFLDNIIENLSNIKMKKLSGWILNILRIGVYSLKFLDKIPVSATVNECVALAKRYGHGASAGFVNALLRRALASGDFLPDRSDPNAYLSLKYSYPPWMIALWEKDGVEDLEGLLKAGNDIPPPYARLNTLKAKEPPEGCEKTEFLPETLVCRFNIAQSAAHRGGLIAAQDAAAQLASAALAPKAGMRVLDMCAAPGGKTAHLAQLMENRGEIVACDIHPHKLDLIQNTAKRLDADIIKTELRDAAQFSPEFEGKFDAVLADLPCSGLGVIRRRPDIKWNKGENDILSLPALQLAMLKNAARYLKTGGVLLYSTCTINRAENAKVSAAFLKECPAMVPLAFAGGFLPGNLSQIQLLPHIHKTDGFYLSRFKKGGAP